MSMKTILLISPYWKEPHRWMVSSVKLAELWQRMGYRVVAVCMGSKTGHEEISPTLTIVQVKDLFLPDPLNYGIAPTFLFHVLRVLKNEKPDIVVVNKVLFWSSLTVPVLRLLGKKPIVTVDALVGMTWWPRGIVPKVLAAVGAVIHAWPVLLVARRVVFFHPQPKVLLRVLGIAGKARVIPTGINASAFRNSKQAPHSPSTPSSGPRGKSQITVTYVGRLESVKGVDDFLEAAVPLKREYPQLTLQVVGWYRNGHPLVRRFGSDVTFTGLRNNVQEILRGTDIFVLPSYSEGLSNALMEALASGCACVATDVGGNAFLIEDGISGLLFPPGDRSALQQRLRTLIANSALRQQFGAAAKKRIEEHFDWSITARKYATLFADVSR